MKWDGAAEWQEWGYGMTGMGRQEEKSRSLAALGMTAVFAAPRNDRSWAGRTEEPPSSLSGFVGEENDVAGAAFF
jgi:hypothetical protein